MVSIRTQFLAFLACLAAVAAGSVRAFAQPDPSGIEFVTVGAPGNAPWPGNGTPGDRAVGRGGTNYEYRIGKFEVTTDQWVRFFNAAYDRPANDRIPFLEIPTFWGAAGTTPNTPGGLRWSVPPGNEMRGVGNISWRMAAIYSNFLHHGGDGGGIVPRENFLSGAYDVSTFGSDANGFTDQATRSPGARYFIPSWDEWLKAAHYDPDRFGAGQGGWWEQPNTTNTVLRYQRPENGGQANAGGWGFDTTILLGAYSAEMSPWGLMDVAGATREWTEEVSLTAGFRTDRLDEGSPWGSSTGTARAADLISFPSGDFPSIAALDHGFRIAAIVPAPGACVLGVWVVLLYARHRKRGAHTCSDETRLWRPF